MRKLIKKIGLIFILLLPLFLIVFFLKTHAGLNVALYALTQCIPGKLTIEQTQGNLSSPILLKKVNYRNDSLSVSLETIKWDWQWWKLLLERQIIFDDLMAEHVKIQIVKSQSTRSMTFTREDLRQSVAQLGVLKLNNAVIRDMHIVYDGYQTQLNSIVIKKSQDNSYLLTLLLSQGIITGHIKGNIHSTVTWSAQVQGKQINPLDFLGNKAITGLVNFDLTSQGKWSASNKVTDFNLKTIEGHINNKRLNGRVHLTSNNDTTQIKNGNVAIEDATLNCQGYIESGKENISWRLMIPNLSTLLNNARGSLFFNGHVENIKGKHIVFSNLLGKDIKISSLELKSIQGEIASQPLKWVTKGQFIIRDFVLGNYKNKNVSLSMLSYPVNDKLVEDITLFLNPHNQINAKLALFDSVTHFKADKSITGNIYFNFSNLAQVIQDNHIKNVAGVVRGQLTVTGNLSAPQLNGTINLTNGQFYIASLGITPRNINLQANFNLNKPLNVKGSFNSGAGGGSLQGVIDIYHDYFPFQISLSGNNLQMLNLPGYNVKVSPNLILNHGLDKKLDISGKAYFPYVEIKTNTVSNGVTLPSEVVFAGSKTSPFITPSNLIMKIEIALGDHIRVAYQDLIAYIGGGLSISQAYGALPTATGQLYITHGSYYIYNQFLTITNGRLIYVGNDLFDPALNIEAIKPMGSSHFSFFTFGQETNVTNAQATYVGALIQGTLNRPSITLISNPPMSQNDILSYLMFGSPASQLAGTNSFAVLGSIASGLNLTSPNAGDGYASVNPLSSGLMQLGAFNPLQVFNFTLPLTTHWMIKTEASVEETGADILYRYSPE